MKENQGFKTEPVVKTNVFCGEITELLQTIDYPQVSIAMAFDIKPTVAHYHTQFDEIYLVIDGELTLKFYDPSTQKMWEEVLLANQYSLIRKDIHHQIVKASDKNRLCIICTPMWRANDECASDVLTSPSHHLR